MTKLRNKLVLVLLALCIVACLGITVACGGGDDNTTPEDSSVTYTVTVTAGGAAAEGVQVTVKKGSATLGTPKTTGNDGKVEFSLAADDYTVTLANLPEGYELPEGTTLTFDANRNLVVTLSEKFAYKIKLVNPDGSAYTADGVTVGICTLEGNCLNPVALGADGFAKIYEVEKTDYHIQVLNLPAGYAYACDEHNYAISKNAAGNYVLTGDENTYNNLSATKTETTVKIYPVEQIKLAEETPLTAEQITATGFNVDGEKAYKFEVTLAAGATAYYSYTPEYDGTYYLYATEAAAYKLNETFLEGDSYLTGGGSFFKTGHTLLGRAGKTYYLNVTNNGDAEVKATFLLTTPVASKVVLETASTVKAVVNKAGANALVVLSPKAGAAYELTVKGNGAIKQVPFESDAKTATFEGAGSSCTAKFTEDMVGRSLYFAVSIEADTYPASVDVEVKKTADLKNETTDVTAAAIADFGTQTGKELVEIELDGSSSAKLVYNDTDKYYHYGAVDGPLVVVILTKALPEERFNSESPIIYLEMSTDGRVAPYVFDVTPAADKTNLEKGNKYADYRNLLRGFKDYKVDSVTQKLSVPADITVDKYYAKAVKNADGAYPLTKELEAFLKAFVQDESVSFFLPWDADPDDLWLFACYYYDDYVEPDVIVGEYNHVMIKAVDGKVLSEKRGDLNGDEYALVINKRGTYTIKDTASFSAEVYETGTWTKNEDVYTFTTKDGNMVYSEFMFDEEEGYITFADNKWENGWAFRNENSELVEFVVGEYKFESYVDAEGTETKVGDQVTEDSYKLTVNADGSFVVYEKSGDNYNEVYNEQGVWTKKNDVYTFTVPNGVYVNDDYANLVFEVAYDIGEGRLTLTGSNNSKWVFKKDGEAFVGIYELVSLTEIDYEGAKTEYNIGDTYTHSYYGEYAVTKDFFILGVVGNTFYLNGFGFTIYNCEGAWTKTNAGKITLSYKDRWGATELPVKYNKADDTYTVTIGDENNGCMIFVFKKKADQTVDPIVGEYTNLVKWVENGEEYTAENGDVRNDDYKLVVRAGGRFDILKYGYPKYEALNDASDGVSGKWTKTDAGYAFTFYGQDENNGYEYGEISYTVTLSQDLSEISLVYTVNEVVDWETGETEEVTRIGWQFTKSAQDAGEADVIVGEYKFVTKTDSYGYTETIGDYYSSYSGSGTIDEDYYNLVVLKSGRFAITRLGEGEVLGFWAEDEGVYTFNIPGRPPVTYTVDFNEAAGRIVLTKVKAAWDDQNGPNEVWVFQKGGDAELSKVYVSVDGDALLQLYSDNTFKFYVGNLQAVVGTLIDGKFTVTGKAESVTTADATNDKGLFRFTVDTKEHIIDPLGSMYGSPLFSTDEEKSAMIVLFSNGVRFCFFDAEADQDTLAYVATIEGVEETENGQTVTLGCLWKLDSIESATVSMVMEQQQLMIIAEVTNSNGTVVTYRFVMPQSN